MTDTLEIFGDEFTGVTGIKATDDNNQTKTYIRPQGNLPITANTQSTDVTQYATVSVAVPDSTFVVTLSWDDDYFGQDEGAWVPDKTYAEIASAYQDEKEVFVKCDDGVAAYWFWDDEEYIFCYVMEVFVEEINYNYIKYRYFYLSSNGLEEDSDNTKYYDSRDASATPAEVASGAQFFTNTGFAIGSATRRSSSDLTASGDTVTVPSGYYASQVTKSVASGTAGTPTATKGTVSNHSVSVTPSVTNTTGYITGSTKTGTAVTVSASELVSGTYTVDSSGTKDVTNYASASVPAMTLPTASSATSSGTSKATITPSSSTQYLNIPTGYNGTAQYYTISAASGGSVTVKTTTMTNNSATATSIQFTSLTGQPKAFFCRCTSNLSRSSSNRYYYIADIRWDGSSTGGVVGNKYYVYNGQYSNQTTGYSQSYSNNTLTLTTTGSQTASPGSFYNGTYELVYIY